MDVEDGEKNRHPAHRLPNDFVFFQVGNFHNYTIRRRNDRGGIGRREPFRIAEEDEGVADEKKEEERKPGREEKAEERENDKHRENPAGFKKRLPAHQSRKFRVRR